MIATTSPHYSCYWKKRTSNTLPISSTWAPIVTSSSWSSVYISSISEITKTPVVSAVEPVIISSSPCITSSIEPIIQYTTPYSSNSSITESGSFVYWTEVVNVTESTYVTETFNIDALPTELLF